MLIEEIRAEAKMLGFTHCGITSASPIPKAEKLFRRWISENRNAEIRYLERNLEKRFDPALIVKDAKSVISLGFPYGDAETAIKNTTGIAVYAWGEDYHKRLRRLAEPILEILKHHSPDSESSFYADSAPLSERSLAIRAGLGWAGKNGTLITPDRGSMIYLAEIVTTTELPEEHHSHENLCGNCRLCIDNCPTGAISEDCLLDASRCISYHTNSSKKPIPDDIASKAGNRIFGCDICQQVCPWNFCDSFSTDQEIKVNSYPENWPAYPEEWIGKDKDWFNDVFAGSALHHTGFAKIMDNVLSALGKGKVHYSPHENDSN